MAPDPYDRAEEPPEGHFTLYESFFYLCYLWFPIPTAILQFLWKYRLALAQINPRGIRHLVGILVRSYERKIDIEADHLMSFLEVRRRGPEEDRKYYLSCKKLRRVIDHFPSKDENAEDYFFFVKVSESSVGPNCLRSVKTKWRQIGSGFVVRLESWRSRLFVLILRLFHDYNQLYSSSCFAVRPPSASEPPGLGKIHKKLAACGCNWKRDFSLQRVERARAIREGLLVEPSSQPSSDYSSDMRRPTFRDKEIAEERERKASEERKRRAAEEVESRSEERCRRTPVDGRLPPPPPAPNRGSGFVPAKCSSLPSSSTGEPLASRPAVRQPKERGSDGGKGRDGTIRQRLADHKRKEIAKDGGGSRNDKSAKKQKRDQPQVTPEPTRDAPQLTTPLTPGALYDNAEA